MPTSSILSSSFPWQKSHSSSASILDVDGDEVEAGTQTGNVPWLHNLLSLIMAVNKTLYFLIFFFFVLTTSSTSRAHFLTISLYRDVSSVHILTTIFSKCGVGRSSNFSVRRRQIVWSNACKLKVRFGVSLLSGSRIYRMKAWLCANGSK